MRSGSAANAEILWTVWNKNRKEIMDICMEVGSVQLPFIFTVINHIISAWQSTTPIQSIA